MSSIHLFLKIVSLFIFCNALGVSESYSLSNTKTYTGCKKKILQSGSKDKATLRRKLNECRRKHPVHKAMAICKREAMKSQGTQRNLKLDRCSELSQMAAHNSESEIPFVSYEGQLIVDGHDFNQVEDFSWISQSGMNCQQLLFATERFSDANFFFHGEDMKELGLKRQVIKTKVTKAAIGQYQFEPFFRVDTKMKKPLAFFPMGRCDYMTPNSLSVNAISKFYLIDYVEKKLYPYSTVFFYHGKRSPDVNTIRRNISRRSFGKAVEEISKKGRTLISDGRLTSFDAEGDPKNICKDTSKLLFTVNKNSVESYSADSAVLTNITSFCSYKIKILSHINSSLRTQN
jgi:hypothetical protein